MLNVATGIPFGNSASVVRGFAIWLALDQRITPYRFWIAYTSLAYFAQADARARLA